jgi:hypothetical protein
MVGACPYLSSRTAQRAAIRWANGLMPVFMWPRFDILGLGVSSVRDGNSSCVKVLPWPSDLASANLWTKLKTAT